MFSSPQEISVSLSFKLPLFSRCLFCGRFHRPYREISHFKPVERKTGRDNHASEPHLSLPDVSLHPLGNLSLHLIHQRFSPEKNFSYMVPDLCGVLVAVFPDSGAGDKKLFKQSKRSIFRHHVFCSG